MLQFQYRIENLNKNNGIPKLKRIYKKCTCIGINKRKILKLASEGKEVLNLCIMMR